MLSRKRHARIAFPRMVAMYLSRELTSHSLEYLGDEYKRHHSSIIHGHVVIDDLMDAYDGVRKSVEYLKNGAGMVDIPPAFMPYANCS